MTTRLGIGLAFLCVGALGQLAAAPTALATFAGANGRIAFSFDPGSLGGEASIASIDAAGGERTPLTPGGAFDNAPSYSPDGERIAYSHNAGNSTQIRAMNADGSGDVAVTPGSAGESDFSPAYSPEGSQIAFSRSEGSSSQIYVMNADGSNPVALTTGSLLSGDPSYSSTGKIVFTRFSPSTSSSEIWTMNADGSDQVPVASGFSPSWSPDATRIAFARIDGGNTSRVYVITADGGDLTPVTNGGSPVFSPDGTRIAFTRSDTFFNFENILTADLDGQNETALTSGSDDHNSTPDWQALNPPTCALDAKPSKSVKRLKLEVTCANEDATVTAAGSGKAPKAPHGAAASKAKKFKIPTVIASVPRGTPTTITLKVAKKGQKAIKTAAAAGKQAKATITTTFTDGLGQSSTDSQKVRFKPKK